MPRRTDPSPHVSVMKTLLLKLLPLVDVLMVPLVYPSALVLKLVRRAGVHRLPACKRALLTVGVFPIRDHYYEPQFQFPSGFDPTGRDRPLPGLDWNVPAQLDLLRDLTFAEELRQTPTQRRDRREFHFGNDAFESGDAEFWYQLIRLKKPQRIVEIGSGYSTLMAAQAIRANQRENPAYTCHHVCIEPYEQPWLEQLSVTVLRKKVEDLDVSVFSDLEENDILFIDSSHVIRPEGDVVFEYLQLLPTLKPGVIVHIHDIFSPRNYPAQWLMTEVRLWNEQYLLEAFLTQNSSWKIIGALNYLHHHHYDALHAAAPFLTRDREPGSFYIQKIRTP